MSDKKEYQKNLGCMNGWGDHLYTLHKEHAEDARSNPEGHTMSSRSLGRCYNEYSCSCGMSYTIDSGD